MGLKEDDIEKKVFLLKLLVKEPDETMDDILKALVNTGMFDLNRAKEILEELRAGGYISGDKLTMLGVTEANKAKQEFTLESW